jgi:hypothetical protein
MQAERITESKAHCAPVIKWDVLLKPGQTYFNGMRKWCHKKQELFLMAMNTEGKRYYPEEDRASTHQYFISKIEHLQDQKLLKGEY